jgi:hypothetical protein
MPLDFPTSPTNGQAYQGYVYSTTIGAWQAKPSAQSPFYTSDTPPSNPVTGDSWFNTNDGTMYIYVYDGNTFQWVEHRSEIARSQVGLVPVKPTSVNVGSGTASVDVGGMITFTGASTLTANGVFTSAFSKYRIVFNARNVGATGNYSIQARFSASTTTSNVNYDNPAVGFLASSGAVQNLGGLNLTQFWLARNYDSGVEVMTTMDIGNPAIAQNTTWTSIGVGSYPSDLQSIISSGVHRVATAYDGFYWSSNNSTGTMKIYGYN